MIKAVFFDIDGTLMSFNTHQIPQSAVDAVKNLRERGVRIFLCTSRCKQFLKNVSGVEYDGLVMLTGANCLDVSRNDIKCCMMNPEDVARLIQYVQDNGKPLLGMSKDAVYVQNPEHPVLLETLDKGGIKVESFQDDVRFFPDLTGLDISVASKRAGELGIMQVTAFFPEGPENDYVLSLMPHSHTERWAQPFVDIIANGTNKSMGIDVMGAHFGFSREETMAFGDGANDSPMIKYASVGIAMGNATDDVKACADYVTDSVDDDGVANAIEHFSALFPVSIITGEHS